MKLYRIYYVLDEDKSPLPEPLLYAITDDKEKVKLFKEQRSSKYYTIKVSDLPKKDALTVMDKCKGQLLTITKFFSTLLNIDVVCTRREEADIVLHSQDIITKEVKKYMINPAIFKSSILSNLIDIDYVEFYKYFHPYITMDDMSDTLDGLSRIDELNLFIFKYGWSLKKK